MRKLRHREVVSNQVVFNSFPSSLGLPAPGAAPLPPGSGSPFLRTTGLLLKDSALCRSGWLSRDKGTNILPKAPGPNLQRPGRRETLQVSTGWSFPVGLQLSPWPQEGTTGQGEKGLAGSRIFWFSQRKGHSEEKAFASGALCASLPTAYTGTHGSSLLIAAWQASGPTSSR